MLQKSVIEDVLQAALETGGDFSEVFVEDRLTNNMTLQSARLEKKFDRQGLWYWDSGFQRVT